MNVMNQKQEKLLADLLIVSRGNPLLVEKALRVSGGPGRSPRLRDVLRYIKENRDDETATLGTPRLGEVRG